MREYRPEKATIILMRPQTGEILAMANRPNYDLNLRSEAKPEQMKNRAIIDMMEPGSTFKIVTAAAAINERKVRLDSMIFCENGVWNIGGRPLHDHGHKGYGDLSVQDILVHSSNIGAAKMAVMLGRTEVLRIHPPLRLWRSHRDRAAGRDPRDGSFAEELEQNFDHPHPDGPGSRRHPAADADGDGDDRERRQTGSAPDRQIDHRRPGQGRQRLQPTVVRQVVSPETAAQIALALRGVVSKRGTAAEAAVPGFTISGKTGTAQKAAPGGGYEKNKYVVSFSGFLPSENPAFVGLVVLDDAHPKDPNLNYGGTVAGPIFSRVAEKAARYLDLEPHEEIETQSHGRTSRLN